MGAYGNSDFAFVYYQPCMRPLELRTSQSPFSLRWSGQSYLSRAVWVWSSEVTIGVVLLRTWALYWWFKALLKVTGLLAAYSALSAFDYLIGASVVLRFVSQVCVTSGIVNAIGLLICVDW